MVSFEELRACLSRRPAVAAEPGARMHAAVALLLRESERGPEVLFIQRAEHDQDPWSGHLGFPGGKIDPEDDGARAAAERETLEEVGVDLRGAELLGQLDDLEGAYLPVVISCFVYLVTEPPPLRLNEEVCDAFWFPLGELSDRERRRTLEICYRGEDLTHPAIQLLGEDRPLLWGITYRLVEGLLKKLEGLGSGT